MRVYNKFLVFLAVSLSIINIVLILMGQKELEIYYTLNTIVFLVVVLHFRLNERAMVALRRIGSFLFIGFVVIITLAVINML